MSSAGTSLHDSGRGPVCTTTRAFGAGGLVVGQSVPGAEVSVERESLLVITSWYAQIIDGVILHEISYQLCGFLRIFLLRHMPALRYRRNDGVGNLFPESEFVV